MLSIQDFATRSNDLIAMLVRLVEMESPTTDKPAVDRVGAVVADELRQLGAAVTIHPASTAGDQVLGRWDPTGRDEIGILTLCHMDTVYNLGTLASQPCHQVDGRLIGPGTMDMKGSIAMLLTALRAFRETGAWPARPITALFTSDEETGSETSRSLIESLARRADLVLCLEPCLPDGSLKTWRKGVGDFQITVRGKAAHAGVDHERGRNAIEELAHQILAIQQLTDYAQGTTVNVGVVAGGGRTNVVPDFAQAQVDLRVMTLAEGERIAEWLRKLKPVLAGTTLEVSGELNRPPMPRDERMVATFARASAIASRLGMAITEGGTGGGSDANFVSPLGVPVLDGLGALGSGAHSEREHILVASLPERTALLAALLSEW